MIDDMRIPCFALAYFDLPTISRSISSLFNHGLCLSVIENPSPSTEHISRHIRYWMMEGEVYAYYLFDRNITNNAFETVIRDRLPFIDSEYILLTDGDVVPECEFVSEQMQILSSCPEVFCCSVRLDTSNLPYESFPECSTWVPPVISSNDLYIEQYGGHHLLMMRTRDLPAFLKYKDERGWTWTDGSLRQYAYTHGMKWAVTRMAQARHLSWDLYADRSHPYTVMRLSRSPSETWDNPNNWAPYTRYTAEHVEHYEAFR